MKISTLVEVLERVKTEKGNDAEISVFDLYLIVSAVDVTLAEQAKLYETRLLSKGAA